MSAAPRRARDQEPPNGSPTGAAAPSPEEVAELLKILLEKSV